MATHDPAHHPAPLPPHDAAHAHGAPVHHAIVPGADKSPAFIGLIVGGIALFAILWGVVQFTNAQFEGHGEGGPRGEHGGPPPAGAPQH